VQLGWQIVAWQAAAAKLVGAGRLKLVKSRHSRFTGGQDEPDSRNQTAAVAGVAQRTAYSHPRRQDQPGHPPQAQAGVSPVPVHRALDAGRAAKQGDVTLADHGAGKSYLGFILYDLFLKDKDAGRVFGIETRPELVSRSEELAARLGFDRMGFLNLTVEQSITSEQLPAQVDIITALHACNTATDDAIRFALAKDAKYIVLVPCCQAEVAAVLRQKKNETFGKTPLSELWRHPIHTREFGSQLTNVLRCLQLEARGYQLTVTELVGWEHSMKNELIIAKKTGKGKQSARERQEAILHELNLEELRERFVY
jgi:hypothetical protein